MIRIVDSRNRRAVQALLAPERARDAARSAAWRRSSAAVRRDGDRALLRYARIRSAGRPDRGFPGRRCARRRQPSRARSARRSVPLPGISACVARRQVPRGWRARVAAGVERRAADRPARSRRLLRARRPLSTALFAPDDGNSRGRGGRAGDRRGLSAPRTGCDGGRARGGRLADVPHRRRACDRRARLRHAHRAARRQDRRARAIATSPRRRRSSPPTAASISTPARRKSSSSPARGPSAWIAADLIAQAEHDPDARAVLITPSRTLAARVARDVAAHSCRTTDLPGHRCARTAASS